MNTRSFHKYFPHFKAIAIVVGVAAAAACGIAAQAQDDAPNPFANLNQAKQQVTSYEKSDPNGPINLESTDVDFTLGRLTTVLSLSPTQQTDVRGILTDQSRRVLQVEGDTKLDREARNLRTDAIFRDSQTRLAKTLTSDQLLKEKYIESQAQSDPDQARIDMLFIYDARFASMPTAMAATNWGTALNLDTTQQLALLPALKDEAQKLDALAADKSLATDQSRIRTQEIMISTERKIDAILTPEQKTRLQTAIILGTTPSSDNPRATAQR